MTVNGVLTDYTYNALDQLTSEVTGSVTTSYGYDSRGNLTTVTESGSTLATYTWNAADRMATATIGADVVTYSYDHDWRRVAEDVNGTVTNYLWDEYSSYGDVLLEYDASNVVQARYVRDNAQPLARIAGASEHYYLLDGQNSVVSLTDGTGTITDTYSYSVFGELLNSTGTTDNPFRYTAQYLDDTTGLYNLRARTYNPSLGRFTSRDTWPLRIGNPLEHNRYVYVAANPGSYYDPSGYTMASYAGSLLPSIRNAPVYATLGAATFCAYRLIASSLPATADYIVGDLCTEIPGLSSLPNIPPISLPPINLPNIPNPIPGIGDPTTFPPMPPLDPRLPNMPPLWPLFPWILPHYPVEDDLVGPVFASSPTDNEILVAIQDKFGGDFGKYDAYSWEFKRRVGETEIFSDNPDPDTGLVGMRIYVIVRGNYDDGSSNIFRDIHVSVNWIPELNRFGRIKLSSSDPGNG